MPIYVTPFVNWLDIALISMLLFEYLVLYPSKELAKKINKGPDKPA